MDNQVIYELLLKDGFSPGMGKAEVAVDKFEKHLGSVKETMLGLFEGIGIAFAGFKIVEFVSQGREEVEKLHQAEAQLTNTMENMGNYSHEAFEKIVEGAYNTSQGILYTQKDIIGLQSQLRLVGNIGETEMNRLVNVSADLSTKFGMGLTEAGNLLAKAVNNPEMARRLGMALKIDPDVMRHIQDLAKHGKEAQARMELLAIAEEKVGGAAQAAFEADPMAKFNKVLYDAKLAVGTLAMDLLKLLVPALTAMVGWVKTAVTWVSEHKELLSELAIGIGVAALAIGIYTVVTNAAAVAQTLAAGATALWNLALDANPIFAVAALIAIFVAAVINAWKHIAAFRAVLTGTWEVIKEFGRIVADVFVGLGKVIAGVLTFNPAMVIEGAKQTISAISDAGERLGTAFKTGYDKGMANFAADAAASLVPDENKNKNKVTPQHETLKVEPPKTKATGTKSITINVTIQKLGETHLSVTNVKEGMKQIHDAVTKTLTDATNDFQTVAEKGG